MLLTYTVARAQYLFGQRKRRNADGSVAGTESDFSASTPARRVAAVAIAPDSEVRGVLVRAGNGDFVPVVEGAPVRLNREASGGLLILDRHDYTDGRLVLLIAEDPEDVALLVGASPVLGYAAVRLHGETIAANHAVHIQRPRAALHLDLAHGGYVFHDDDGTVQRDRRWLVNGRLITTGLDSLDTTDEFGDQTFADTRAAVSTITTAADVVVTRIGAAGTLSLALRWAETPTVTVEVPE